MDIEKELKFTMFLWEDLNGFNDIYLMGELARFRDETYYTLQDLLYELKKYGVVPLSWTPEVKRIKQKKEPKRNKFKKQETLSAQKKKQDFAIF